MNDLDHKVALARGWEYLEDEGEPVGYYRKNDNPIVLSCEQYRPSTSIAQAYELENEVLKEGLEWKYLFALMQVVHGPHVPKFTDLTVRGLYFIVHATPEQRCLAFLKAKGKEAQDEP